MGIIETLVGAAAPTIGAATGIATGAFNIAEQRKWNERSEANTWGMYNQEREDASRAHQIEVADLKKAGLNPILSAGKGPGASTASGSASSPTSPQMATPDIMGMFATAKQLEQRDIELQQQNRKLGIDLMGVMADKNYKEILGRNEKYSIKGMMADFFNELKNEQGEHLNLNDFMNFIQMINKNIKMKPSNKQPLPMGEFAPQG